MSRGPGPARPARPARHAASTNRLPPCQLNVVTLCGGGVLWTTTDASGCVPPPQRTLRVRLRQQSLPQTPPAAPYPTAAPQTNHRPAIATNAP